MFIYTLIDPLFPIVKYVGRARDMRVRMQQRWSKYDLARTQNEHRSQGTRTDQHVYDINKLKRRGRGTAYLLRRLARERPDLLDAFERGAFKSARPPPSSPASSSRQRRSTLFVFPARAAAARSNPAAPMLRAGRPAPTIQPLTIDNGRLPMVEMGRFRLATAPKPGLRV